MPAQADTSALNTRNMHKTGNFGQIVSSEARIDIEEEGSDHEEQEVRVSQKYLDIIKA
jgi:hypothetical protein